MSTKGVYCLLAILCASVHAIEVPDWVLRGLVFIESSSRYEDGKIVYVNRARGRDGEVGPTQILPSTFRHYAKPGERIERLETDMAFAEAFTIRILSDLYERTQSWIIALSYYHTGRLTRTGKNYGHRVAWVGHNSMNTEVK